MRIVSNTLPCSDKVKAGLTLIEKGRYQKQARWGKGLTVLDAETVKAPLVIRKALAVKKVLSEMPVTIRDHELIVGSAIRGALMERVPFPEYATKEEEAAALKKRVNPWSVFGHSAPFYPRYLKLGLPGIRKMAEDKLAEVKQKGTEPGKETWYEAVLISLDGLETLIRRYGDLAAELAQKKTDPTRKAELEGIATIAQNLIAGPPQSFREAVQAFWFAHVALHSTLNSVPSGRFDQYMWPFLEHDFEKNLITINEAQNLVDLLWVKFNELLQAFQIQDMVINSDGVVSSIGHKDNFYEVIYPHFLGGKTTVDRLGRYIDGGTSQQFLQSITVSGLTPQGEDGTNPLSYICLNATRRLNVPQPCMYVRLHDNSPSELYERAADCIRAGCIGPTFYNDEVLVPSLNNNGLPLEIARDYSSDGCFEIILPGRTEFWHTFISVAEALERVISPNRWEELEVPNYVAEMDPFTKSETRDPYSFNSFDEIMEAVKEKLDVYIKGFIESAESCRSDHRHYEIAPLPFFSSLVEGPLESGKDITQGGTRYYFFMPEMSGLSHAADSLAAIKKLCFDEKRVPWSELLDAIRNNWEGKESLRQLVRTRAPAYGNDDDYADDIAKEIVEFYVASLRKHSTNVPDNVKYNAALATFEHYTNLGRLIGATPDGRLSGEPLSTNGSPSIGRPVNGQTAALNSYVKLPLVKLQGCSMLDLNFGPRMELLNQMESFIKSFVAKRGNGMTLSVTNCEKLRAAKKDPEKYRDLKVRVGGFEAYFTDLPTNHQDMQIKRCEQYA